MAFCNKFSMALAVTGRYDLVSMTVYLGFHFCVFGDTGLGWPFHDEDFRQCSMKCSRGNASGVVYSSRYSTSM